VNTVTVRVPIKLRWQGSLKAIVTPAGSLPMPAWVDITLVKALARAFRWRKLQETGRYTTIDELARAEKINASYVSRILRLTLLAPEIVEAALDGHPAAPDVRALMAGFPVEWDLQRTCLPDGGSFTDVAAKHT